MWFRLIIACYILVYTDNLPGGLALRGRASLSEPATSCSLNNPKVALLYLFKAPTELEPVWREWFIKAAEVSENSRHCDFSSSVHHGPGVLEAQHLFSVLVHMQPGVEPSEDSIFANSWTDRRFEIKWGESIMVEAERELFRVALQNQHNKRFMLISDTDIPLYPPQVVYREIITQTQSRINACEQTHIPRWHPRMEYKHNLIPLSSWRGGSQWMSLLREHAEDVVDDTVLWHLFSLYCTGTERDYNPNYKCVSDEHYIQVLLAYLKKEDETDCMGSVTRVYMDDGPTFYRAALMDINATFIESFRRVSWAPACDTDLAFRLAQEEVSRAVEAASISHFSPQVLKGQCSLFARKFMGGSDTTEAVIKAMKDPLLAIL